MPRISFTFNLQRHLDVAPLEVPGATVGAVLAEVFAVNPRLRSYLLDDQGRLRQHVAIFVDGEQVADRQGLSDRVGETGEVYVVQALSGG
ncbi:MoaD/ThiS family protein [Pseudomonas lalucatii]|uniref:MoaD/ThiS family protein n=1 Tax=Pseudomonas lalucatii TaxID=1424203 RepID=A0ABS5Q107_9PSED|nr:MoaD/ThiS family protein [Pseudomonas lalucatii]MBS7662188.1 MoaD/ThiS family protein [Pseudomonas lalucatii]MBS7690417.1 MoaD/ThiS family protein [Pseudomonas lalucatii]MBS7726055.1 MoaD/ThiS family protein [Pseudomonas lalucatii]QVM88372.1 MoaD/ThiS family protein [Pseudomonas lalucatii]